MARWGNTFISNIFWCFIFGFFAFGYTDEPRSLYVSNEGDLVKFFPVIDNDQVPGINQAVPYMPVINSKLGTNATVTSDPNADEDVDLDEESEVANVGHRFHLFFLYNFIISILQMVNCQLFFLAMGFGFGHRFIYHLSKVTDILSMFLGIASLGLWVLVVIWRF